MAKGLDGNGRAGAPPLPREVDGIFVGGGHNSLVAAAYLAKAGQSVLVLEGADRIGGGVVTKELTLPLFRHNTHAFFVRWTNDYRIWRDLDLDRYGVRSIFPEVQYALPYEGGERALLFYNSLGPSLESIRKLSPEDARTYERLFPEWKEAVIRILGPLYFSAPLSLEETKEVLSHSELGRRFLGWNERSALDVIREWFVSEPMRALALFVCSVRGYLSALDQPGTGYLVPLALFTSHASRIIEGGSERVLRAIAASVYAGGGLMATRSPVASVDVVDGRARGVTTTDSRYVRARKFVASSVPAPMTLLDMVGRNHLDASLVEALEGYHWRDEGLFGVHLALDGVPRFKNEASEPDVSRSLNLALGFEGSQDFVEHIEAIRGRGEVPAHPTLHASIPTMNDPSQAPPGHHTVLGWEEVPAREKDGSGRRWERAAAEAQGRRMIETFARYAPDLKDHILAFETHSPADTAAEIPSMYNGDWHHGSYHPDNWGHSRPHPSLSGYATPIEGLYLCGSSQHPGGSFSGMPGFNAAGKIADDIGAEVWWGRATAHQTLAALAPA